MHIRENKKAATVLSTFQPEDKLSVNKDNKSENISFFHFLIV